MSAEVVAKLKLDTVEYLSRLRDAEKGMENHAKKSAVSLKGLGEAAKSVGKSIAVAIGGAAVGAVTALSYSLQSAMRDGVTLNAQFESSRITIQSFVKDVATTNKMVSALNAEARNFGFDPNEMSQAGQMLITYAKGSTDELMKLIKTAEILTAMNPAQGLTGAAFSLREALSGDFVSIQDRFNLPRSLINQLKSEGKEGFEIVEAALKQLGAGPELVSNLSGSFAGLSNNIKGTFTEVKRVMAEPVFEVMKEAMVDFAEALKGGVGNDITVWAKDVGKALGENAKAMVESLKQVNWHSLMMSVQQLTVALGKAAEVVASTFGGAVDLKTAVEERGLKASHQIARLLGDKEEMARIEERQRQILAADSATQRRQQAQPVTQQAIVDNYARAHGVTPEQARQMITIRLQQKNSIHNVMAT